MDNEAYDPFVPRQASLTGRDNGEILILLILLQFLSVSGSNLRFK